MKNQDEHNAKKRAYSARPEVKARRQERDGAPNSLAKRRVREHKALPDRHKKLRANEGRWKAKLADQRERRTGFSPELVQALLIEQNQSCAVCGTHIEGRHIRADHCHKTNAPRGLLCHRCNIVEGLVGRSGLDYRDYLERLINYIHCPPALKVTRP